MMIKKVMLENIVASEHGTIGYQTARRIASELLAAREVVKAAREAAKGEGRFSRDPLTHADNCIEDMKGVLNAALAAYDAATKGGA